MTINTIPIVAICYDFDKTLSPDDMQTYEFIPSVHMTVSDFWAESNALADANQMDKNLAWMYMMLSKSKAHNKSVRKSAFTEMGRTVELFNGVPEWFDRVNQYAASKGLRVEHYVISSGLKEIIEGSSIAHNFKRIYGSTFMYDVDGIAVWPAQAVNYTNKTQFIFRIAKGFLDESDERVNDSMNTCNLRVPYENFIYIGDSDTDIPCMRVVTDKGGLAVGVYNPQTNKREKVYRLYDEKRIGAFAPADYSEAGSLFDIVKRRIDWVAANEQVKGLQGELDKLTEPYADYKRIEATMYADGRCPTPEELRLLKKMKSGIEGVF